MSRINSKKQKRIDAEVRKEKRHKKQLRDLRRAKNKTNN